MFAKVVLIHRTIHKNGIKIPLSMCYSFVTSMTNACYSDIIRTFASQPDDAGTSPRSYIKCVASNRTATKQYDL